MGIAKSVAPSWILPSLCTIILAVLAFDIRLASNGHMTAVIFKSPKVQSLEKRTFLLHVRKSV